ncbi:barstar family protein [Streptosporangium sp. NPDC004379]|uniref:barstar family protein n=1 Tax=Streptosporangium sp. NPDC004379 TaxID=3366189 RepID=UPI0036C6C505
MTSTARPLPPWLTVTTAPAPAVVDGRACRTRAAFFEEAARALRLPDHFGRNWDALTDCLRDVGEVRLIVEHAEELLGAEPPEQFAVLLAVLAGAAEAGLTTVLHTDPAKKPLLRERIVAALP